VANLNFNPEAAFRELAGELFIVTPDRALHHIALPSAVEIVKALRAGPVDQRTIVTQLVDRFEVTEARATTDVATFLQTLVEANIACIDEANP
tara:strand:+ start:153 stop:431 length:279 start_codon:yes stop_codon:yes gene_type:complete